MTKAEIQFVRSLADKQVRDTERLFIAEGEKLIGEILESHLRIRQIYALEGVLQGRAEVVTPKEMERISQLKSASNCLAVVEQPRFTTPAAAPATALSLALDGVQNPGNLGTIIRLADWFGISDIFCSESTADCYNPKVVQATMGALARVRVHYVDDLTHILSRLQAAGYPIYGTLLDGQSIYQTNAIPDKSKGIIVMGNEGNGISMSVRETITHPILIPSFPANIPTSESLNVSIATAIVLAEFRR